MTITRRLAHASLLLAIAIAAPLHATEPEAPRPLRVWIYGDGNSARVAGELTRLGDDDLVIETRAREQTGTWNLAAALDEDLAANDPPDVVVIGYSASAASSWFCHFIHLDPPAWTPGIPAQEAVEILAAAERLEALSVSVLLTKGPGVPIRTALARPDIARCLEDSYRIVWEATRVSGLPHVDWSLPRDRADLWIGDGIHLSCDPDRYDESPYFPSGTTYDPQKLCGYPPPRDERDAIAAATIARRIRAALERYR